MADQDHPARGTVAIGKVSAVDGPHAKGRKKDGDALRNAQSGERR